MASVGSHDRGILTAPARGILTGILTGALALSVAPEFVGERTDVIVRGDDAAAVAAAVEQLGGEVEFEIGLIDGVSARVPSGRLDALRADARIEAVSLDAPVELMAQRGLSKDHRGVTPDQAVLALGGQAMRDGGFDGTGIDVAVIDSGVRERRGMVVDAALDISFGDERSRDGFGHGTAMGSIIALADSRGGYVGVAPDARIVDVKVADENGVADISQVLAGIDWAVSNRDTDGRNIRVLSLSFGTNGSNPADTSPLVYAAEAAWRHGIVTVVSAGNHGADLGRLATPAISPHVISVGAADLGDLAVDGDETVPGFSAHGDGVRNPDILAPGRSILSATSSGSTIEQQHPDALEGGDYLLGSGTSQAAAFTAGVAAAVLEARPELTPDDVKHLLVSTARDLADVPAVRDGAGLIDLDALFSRILGELGTPGTPSTPPYKAGSAGVQPHPFSDGSGSLDGDRGNFFVEDADGNVLSGENTVVGAFDRDAWKASTWSGSTWSGSTWSGSTWSGSTWSASTWSSSTWSGSTWSASTWSGSTWSTSTWSNAIWGE